MASSDQPSGAGTMAQLRQARERLDAKDLPGAVAIYDEILKTSAGDRADVLVSISGDLGSTGHIRELIELVAPRYDAARHGAATGFNLLQAYIGARDPEPAQHILDILFGLNRPDLEERLFGFSNAISELLLSDSLGAGSPEGAMAVPEAGDQTPKVGVATISKPVWYYGLEALADRILPVKSPKLRNIAFAQLALPGTAGKPYDEIARQYTDVLRLSTALPVWLAEIFMFSPTYAPVAAVAYIERPGAAREPMVFGAEWTTENLRHLVESGNTSLDYIFTGAIRQHAGDYELILRLWEVKKFRERKQFSARWTPATVNAELDKLREQICLFMEWQPLPAGSGLDYPFPSAPRAWLDLLGISLDLFVAEKVLQQSRFVAPLAAGRRAADAAAPHSAVASLAWLTTEHRALLQQLELPEGGPELSSDPIVAHAQDALAHG
jgi:hypothetical protein